MTTRRTAVDDLQRAATIPLILGAPLQSERATSPIERWSLFPLLLNLGDPVTSFGHGTSDVIQLPRSGLLFSLQTTPAVMRGHSVYTIDC